MYRVVWTYSQADYVQCLSRVKLAGTRSVPGKLIRELWLWDDGGVERLTLTERKFKKLPEEWEPGEKW